MAMCLLPTYLIPTAWSYLRIPPLVDNPSLSERMTAFSMYFEKTWMSGLYQHSLWSHFDNNGPRTTNVAEGWHNSLNSDFRMPHPSLRNFLHWLLKCQFNVQCRLTQLKAGRPAKPRLATYIQLDNSIMQEKIKLTLRCGNAFMSNHTNDVAMQQIFCCEIDHYLSRISYLIAGNF